MVFGCMPTSLNLSPDSSLQKAVETVVAAVKAAEPPGALVGVGLAGSLLLAAAAGLGQTGSRVLALFPALGWDSPAYGHAARPTAWPQRWLSLARLPGWRSWLSRVAISPTPGGLEGVYAGGLPSWHDAATALPSAECTALLVPVACEATVVLNGSSPSLDVSRAQVLMTALNSRIGAAVAEPGAAGLAQAVSKWALGDEFELEGGGRG